MYFYKGFLFERKERSPVQTSLNPKWRLLEGYCSSSQTVSLHWLWDETPGHGGACLLCLSLLCVSEVPGPVWLVSFLVTLTMASHAVSWYLGGQLLVAGIVMLPAVPCLVDTYPGGVTGVTCSAGSMLRMWGHALPLYPLRTYLLF